MARTKLSASERKQRPVASGVVDYFPDALQEVALVSWTGNEQHNPGQPLHWAREKSTDEADALMRHFIERGKRDTDGMRHSAKVAWRALALLQKEIENETTHRVVPNSVPDLEESPSKDVSLGNYSLHAWCNGAGQESQSPSEPSKSENCTHDIESSSESSDSDPLHLVDE